MCWRDRIDTRGVDAVAAMLEVVEHDRAALFYHDIPPEIKELSLSPLLCRLQIQARFITPRARTKCEQRWKGTDSQHRKRTSLDPEKRGNTAQ